MRFGVFVFDGHFDVIRVLFRVLGFRVLGFRV
jgi:hypothetical protein